MNMGGVTVLIAAAGKGSRFVAGHDIAKQYVLLCGIPILRHSINAFYRHPEVSDIRVIIHPDDIDLYEEAVAGLDLLPPVFGGSTRQESIRLGLESLQALSPVPKRVLIHDAARPFVSSKIITAVIHQLEVSGAVIPAIPVEDTIKKCSAGKIMWTVERADLWRAQTPQGFLYTDILKFHTLHQDKNFSDDATVAEYAGMDVSIIPGSVNNFKITTDYDYERAEFVALQQIEHSVKEVRVGTGFDVHCFSQMPSADGMITLGGIKIKHPYSLEGHSDADVLLHAITDAVLGATGQLDMGQLFPDTNDKWKGASSAIFLKQACRLAQASGGKVINVDATIICDAPKISLHRKALQQSVADIMRIDVSRINLKGKTTEGICFQNGNRHGITVQAVVAVNFSTIDDSYKKVAI